MQLTGAEIVIECLKEQGVDTVFGYPGGAILNVYDALYKHSDEITNSNLAIISQTYMFIYSLILQSHYRNLTQRLFTAILKCIFTMTS